MVKAKKKKAAAEGTHCDACKVTTTEELVEVSGAAGVSRICPGCKEAHDKAPAPAAAAVPVEEQSAAEGDDDDQVEGDDEGDSEEGDEGDGEEENDDQAAGDAGGEGDV